MMEDEMWRPFNGATSWSDLDAFLDSSRQSGKLNEITWQFQCLLENILNEDDLSDTQRTAAIESASTELAKRMKNPEKYVKSKSLVERVKALIVGEKERVIQDGLDDMPRYAIGPGGTISVTKSADGSYRWVGVYSNAFKDREGEIITETAHKEFVEHANKTKEYPELWLWHTPGTRIGVADWLDTHEGFAIASGGFDANVPATIIETLAEQPDIAMSHGFRYRVSDKSNGVYSRYRSEEISLLPREHVANELTGFGTLEVEMEAEREKWLRKFLGDEQVSALKSALTNVRIEAEKNGFSLKSIAAPILEMEAGTTAVATPVATEAPPAPAPAPAPAPTEPDIVAQLRELLAPIVDEQKALRAELDAQKSAKKSFDEEVSTAVAEMIRPRSGPGAQVAQKSAQFGSQATLVTDNNDPDVAAAKAGNTTEYTGVAGEYAKFAPGIAALMAPPQPNGKRN